MKSDLDLVLLPRLASGLIRALYASLRIRDFHRERMEALHEGDRPFVLTFWHGHLLMMVRAGFRLPLTVMISQHRDGELIARSMERFGVTPARGSTTRGGSEALREMIRAARGGARLAITPDGPRGPRRVAQPGVVAVAQRAGIPVLPAAFVAERRKTFRSWDRFEMAMPFSRALYLFGEPIDVPRGLSDEEGEAMRLRIERAVNDLARRGEEEFESTWKESIPRSD